MGKAARANAQRRKAEMGAMILTEMERWGDPPSEQEAAWLREVLKLPRVTVTRPPDEALLASGMTPKDCHLNCSAQERNDEGQSKHITGWMIDGPALVLHSIIEARGQYLCITPQLVPAANTFDFIPDPAMTWIPDGNGGRVLRRHGEEVRVGLRAYPEIHVEMLAEFRRLVESGMDPMDAYQEVDGTFGSRLVAMPLVAA